MLTKFRDQILSVSPRNIIADHISLFEVTDCNILLTPSALHTVTVTSILKNRSLKVIDSSSLYELLDGVYRHYPYLKTFAEARLESLVALHTFRTTNTSKHIIYTHDFAASYSVWGRLLPPSGLRTRWYWSSRAEYSLSHPSFTYVKQRCPLWLVLTQIYHKPRPRLTSNVKVDNLFATLFDALVNQTTIVTPLADVIPSAQLVVVSLKRVRVDSLLLISPFLKTIVSRSEMLDFVTKIVSLISYGGGNISRFAGDAFTAKTQIFNMYGFTEIISIPIIYSSDRWSSEDWSYINSHSEARIEFRVVAAEGGLFETVIVRKIEFEVKQPVFKIFSHLTVYSIKDLFAFHSSNPGLWIHKGRRDDTIVFKPGYMCNLIATERSVSHHSEVCVTLMTGTGRFQPALLVEPASEHSLSAQGKKELFERLWPVVQKVNEGYKLSTRISKTLILILDQKRPMRYAEKGTVQRAPTLNLYKKMLNTLYAREGDISPSNDLVLSMSSYLTTSSSDLGTEADLNGFWNFCALEILCLRQFKLSKPEMH